MGAPGPAAGVAPLWWHPGGDIFDGQTISRFDVAATGASSPVPPGIPRDPGPGQYYASPALAALLRSTPADQLADRYPGHLAGTIGDAALPSPASLVIIIGRTPAQLARTPNSVQVTSISTTVLGVPPPQAEANPKGLTYTPADPGGGAGATDLILSVVALAILAPVLIFIATATRLSAARREERFAAMRLVGATRRQVSLLAATESTVAATLGVAAGFGIFFLLRIPVAGIPFIGQPFFPAELTLSLPDILAVAIGVPVSAAVAARLALRRVHISPLGVARRADAAAAARLAGGAAAGWPGRARVLDHPRPPGLHARADPGVRVQLRAHHRRPVHRGPVAHHGRRQGHGPLDQPPRHTDRRPPPRRRPEGRLPRRQRPGARPVHHHRGRGGHHHAERQERHPVEQRRGSERADRPGIGVEPGARPWPGSESGHGAPGTGRARRAADGTAERDLRRPGGARGPRGPGADHPRRHFTASAPDLGSTSPVPAGVVSCAQLATVPALGRCPAGATAAAFPADGFNGPLFGTDATTITWPAANVPATRLDTLGVDAINVATNGTKPAVEQARTLLENASAYPGVSTPSTIGDLVAKDNSNNNDYQQLANVVILISLPIAGCTLAAGIAAGLADRKRPFSLLRLTGARLATLRRVVALEGAVPLLAVAAVAIGTGFAGAAMFATEAQQHPMVAPGAAYYLLTAGGILVSLGIIAATFPLLARITGPEVARNE